MNQFLRKSLYTSLASLSLLPLFSLSASANSSYEYNYNYSHHSSISRTMNKKVTAKYSVLRLPEKGAYAKATGNCTMFDKPGALGNASVVAPRNTLRNWSHQHSAKNIFYVYGMAKTSNGYYYAKVVTLGGKYRGWIYAGEHDFSNDLSNLDNNSGLVEDHPLCYGKMPRMKYDYHIKADLWTTPNYSRIDSRPLNFNYKRYAKDTFKIESCVMNKQNWRYYYVVDEQHPNICGWIFHNNVRRYY
ncbi:hypothetical protein [Apilactobacillus quenuiae]|uniref:hypothetical protein n=1 Tax=Apilactobacillus quenuiae TaxID=2008377 RepID=UPI000D015D57|nr:hypothetical protein [Apilactobacillus quenuiae]